MAKVCRKPIRVLVCTRTGTGGPDGDLVTPGRVRPPCRVRLRLRGPLASDPMARLLHAEAGPVAALILLRLVLFQHGSVAYLAGSWLHTRVSITLNGGIHSTAQIIYATLPIRATWLLGYRAAPGTAGLRCHAKTALVDMWARLILEAEEIRRHETFPFDGNRATRFEGVLLLQEVVSRFSHLNSSRFAMALHS